MAFSSLSSRHISLVTTNREPPSTLILPKNKLSHTFRFQSPNSSYHLCHHQVLSLTFPSSSKKFSVLKCLSQKKSTQDSERLFSNLNQVTLKREPDEEDLLIIKAHAVHGNKWATIGRLLQGRTDDAIKSHWNSTLRRRCIELGQYKGTLTSEMMEDASQDKTKASSEETLSCGAVNSFKSWEGKDIAVSFGEDQVTGFHNWLQFYLEEAKGRVDYQGYIFPRRCGETPDSETHLLTIQFAWNGVLKAVSSTLVGVN